MPPESRGNEMDSRGQQKTKLGVVNGVFNPVVLNIISILMFLRFGSILGRVGLLGMLGLLITAYFVDLVTALSLSAIASNGEVKGGGAYYLISRSLGPEFGGSIGVLFFLSQVLNTALNVVGLIDCLKLNLEDLVPGGYWEGYLMESCVLVICTCLCLAGSGIFARAGNALLVVLLVSTISIPVSTFAKTPFRDVQAGVVFTGPKAETLASNLYPHKLGQHYRGFDTFRELFGILFPATSGIFAGASMSGDLRNPSKAIPVGTLWAMLSTFVLYLLVILSMASSVTHSSFLRETNIVSIISVWKPIVLAGEVATTLFSVLMGITASAKLLQALARDKLLPGLTPFGRGTKGADEPILAILLTFVFAQVALLADLNQIATLISMGYQVTFFVMNLACFLLKIGSAPNFRPAFKFFSWQTAFIGSVLSAAAMFFIDETYAALAICLMIFLFLLIHYLSPPRHWGDVSQNLIYHQVRKYLLRLKPEHIKFWRPQIILLVNNPRRHTRMIQFCNSLKKGALYILGHVIVTDDFGTGVHEAKLQQAAWTRYISEYSRIKAFVQLTMSPTIEWGVRNLILSAGLGGMRPNIAVLGFYNMDELRETSTSGSVPQVPASPSTTKHLEDKSSGNGRRRRGDTSARLLEGFLPTDTIRTESMLSVKSYLTIVEDLALRHRLNVAIGKGFQNLETPRQDRSNTKKYVDLWPIQMSAEITTEGKNIVTTNFDTCEYNFSRVDFAKLDGTGRDLRANRETDTLILQLGYILLSVPTWKRAFQLRVLVFVEYESEVKEERARVNALLEKLRIDAEVHVLWLASGQVGSYETIVNGRPTSPENEEIINDLLKGDEWWDELRSVRSRSAQALQPQSQSEMGYSLGRILVSARRRSSTNGELQDGTSPRRQSFQEFMDLPKQSTVSRIARLGVNVGIRTQNLSQNVFEDGEEGIYDEFGGHDESDSSDADFNDEGSNLSEADLDTPIHRPLLYPQRRKSHGDLLRKPGVPKQEGRKSNRTGQGSASGYGTMGVQPPPILDMRQTTTPTTSLEPIKNVESFDMLSPIREPNDGGRDTGVSSTPPVRPGFSRKSSATKFSSRPTPETTIAESSDAGPRITFKSTEESGAEIKRPPLSRNSSMGRFSSRVVPEMTVDQEGGPEPRLTFAEPESRDTGTYLRSRPDSSSKEDGEARDEPNIPALLEAYHLDAGTGYQPNYSAQGLPLSFNDLPSRAQHFILNELIRKKSDKTAVVLTTLPIPDDGTSLSEEASLRYLSDIEVLCHELPPVLLVLSNNMTVTVSL